MPDDLTLAQRIRAKHPGAYDDIDDVALEDKVRAKFPGVYDDIRQTEAAAEPSAEMPAAATMPGLLPPSDATNPGPVSKPASLRAGVTDFEQATMADPLKRVGIGANKAAENSVIGAAEGMRRYVPGVGRAADAIHGRDTSGDLAAARAGNQADGAAERIGYGIEQVAEFVALPTGKGGMVRRVAQEGAQSAALSAAQGGDPITGAVSGAAGPVIARGAQAARPVIERAAGAMREGAEKRVTQALGATKERFKAMAEKIAPDMLERGVPGAAGASRSGLLETAKSKAAIAGKAIDDALTAAKGEVVQTAPITDALEEAKAAFQIQKRMTVQEAARLGKTANATDVGGGMVEIPVVLDSRPIRQLSKLQQTLSELGESATVEQIVAVRRVWDDVVARAGGFAHRRSAAFGVPLADQSEAWAKREATTAIRKALSEAQPDLAALNKEFAFWANLRDVLGATQKRTQAQSGGIGQIIVGGAGATVGAASGGSLEDSAQSAILGGAIGGAVGRQFMRAVTSPRWRFVSASVRNKLADALVNGNHGAITAALARANAALQGGGAVQPALAR